MMEEPPPGAFHRDVADGDQRVLDELESLRKENLLYAEKLSK